MARSIKVPMGGCFCSKCEMAGTYSYKIPGEPQLEYDQKNAFSPRHECCGILYRVGTRAARVITSPDPHLQTERPLLSAPSSTP